MASQILSWQQALHGLLSEHIQHINENPKLHGLALMGLSFAYGIFHALGPGHGKAIIVAYLGTHPESVRRGVMISLAAALFQASVAVLLVAVLARLLSWKLSAVQQFGHQLTSVSYALVVLLGFTLMMSALWRLHKLRASPGGHSHSACCGGHHHAGGGQPEQDWLATLGLIISMGIRPCLGAVMVLIYAHLVGAWFYGVLATLIMGLGTGLSVMGIAIGTQFARAWLERQAAHSQHPSHAHTSTLWVWVRLAGGGLITLLGWSLYQASMIIASGNHPLI